MLSIGLERLIKKADDSFAGVSRTNSIKQWAPHHLNRLLQSTAGTVGELSESIQSVSWDAIQSFTWGVQDSFDFLIEGTRGSLESIIPFQFTAYEPKLWPIDPTDLTEPAREALNSVANHKLAQEAKVVLDELSEQLYLLGHLENLPPIRLFETDEESLLIEWIFEHMRIGFGIELDQRDSGWFLVSDETAGNINALGHLEGENLARLINWLVSFVAFYFPEHS